MKSNLDDLEAVRKVVEILEPFDATARERILRWSCEKLGMQGAVPASSERASIVPAHLGSARSSGTGRTASSIRAFVQTKNISNDQQFAIAAAYFYRFEASEEEKKQSITPDDLVDACRKAGRKRPSRARQTLVNAVASGFLDRVGRGSYAINSAGENLVAVELGG